MPNTWSSKVILGITMLDADLVEMRELEDQYWWFVARRRLVLALLDDAKPRSDCLLDGGCGTGAMLAELNHRGLAYGVDVSSAALKLCRERGLERLAQMDLQCLAFAAESFTAATLCDVLEHIENDRQALDEIARVLQPGGVLIATFPALNVLWSSHDEALGHRRRYNAHEVYQIFNAAGLTVEKLSYGLFFLFPVALVLRAGQRLLNRLRPRPARTGIIPIPRWLNRLIIGLMDLENAIIRRLNLPIGVSLVAVGRKGRSRVSEVTSG
ncbi:MAG: methyltransferase domain-containing protein [Candidatus Zipacnadales bacterium]